MKKRVSILLALALLLTSCGGGGASAATMHLRRAEGTVGVADGEGKTIEPRENLGLYSGYGVDTQTESYAWIDLDEAKLTKLDQDSEIAITKEGKKLEIEVKSGNLFFNVTEPLDDDETLNIRSSTMLVGIRGTCGWVTQDAAALLEGTVEVTAGEQTVTVSAGEMAVLTGDGALEVKPFSSASVPAFVRAEIAEDDGLAEEIKTASGIDLKATAGTRDYSHMRISNYFEDGTLYSFSEYFYDDDNHWRQEHYEITNGQTELFYYGESTLDEQGRSVSSIMINNEISSTTRLEEETTDHKTYRSYNAGGQITSERVEYLDEQGQVTRSEATSYQADGTLFSQSVSHYDYDEYGGCIRNETQSTAADGTVTQSIQTHENTYDAQGRLIREDTYDEGGTLQYYTLYEYD